MSLQYLANIHTARHAKRIQNYVNCSAVGQKRHLLHGNDARNDTFIAVAAGHFIALGDLSLLRDADSHELVDAGRQFRVLFSLEDLDLNYLAALALRDTQRRILDLTRLLTENCPQ